MALNIVTIPPVSAPSDLLKSHNDLIIQTIAALQGVSSTVGIGSRLRAAARAAAASNPMINGVMGSPPTVSISASHNSALTTNVDFRVVGAPIEMAGSNLDSNGYLYSAGQHFYGNTTVYFARISFMTDAPIFEFDLLGTGQYVNFIVDGVYVTATSSPTLSNARYCQLDFSGVGGRKLRKITLEVPIYQVVRGVHILPTDTLIAPPTKSIQALFLGDSISNGQLADTQDGLFFPSVTASHLGWLAYNMGLSATGYVSRGTYPTADMASRATNSIIPYNPDVIVVALGVNDYNQSIPAVQAQATVLINTIRTLLPITPIFVLGPWYTIAATGATLTALAAGIKAGVLAPMTGNVWFIDNIAAKWQTGTGSTGATAGDGNGDFYMGTTPPHPGDAGHLFLGRMLANAIRDIIEVM